MTITVPAAMPAMPTTDASPVNTGPTPELPVFGAMEVQQGAAIDGGRFANPASLANELLSSLRGFMERAERVSQRISQPVGEAQGGIAMVRVADASNVSFVNLHAGPARQSLDPAGTAAGQVGAGEASNELEFVRQVSDELFDAAIYRMEAQLIGRGAGHIASSVNTLLKGQ
jgi:hypothetical protein